MRVESGEQKAESTGLKVVAARLISESESEAEAESESESEPERIQIPDTSHQCPQSLQLDPCNSALPELPVWLVVIGRIINQQLSASQLNSVEVN